jgi:HEXXH motif-containing protein
VQTQGLLFGPPVDPDTLAPTLRDELRRRRAQLVRLAITRPDQLREGVSPLQAAVLRRALAQATSRRLAEHLPCLDNWAAALALKNVFRSPRSETAFQPLLAELLFIADGSGDSLLSGLSFDLRAAAGGSIHVPGAAVRVTWTGGATPSLHWTCGQRFAEVTDPTSGRSATVPLPLTSAPADGPITVTAYDRVPGLDLAVLPRAAAEACGFGSLPYSAGNGSSALTLVESVDVASQLLHRVWPERLVWTTALLPAIIDLGVTGDGRQRLSGSFEPGIPIYFSRVSEPFSHAEDLVHEVQHLRFPLTIPANEWFGRWTDMACDYTSPYRPDPRPLQGLHLGLHAFVAVIEFRLRALDLNHYAPFSLQDLVDTHWRNLYACETILTHEELSADGRRYYGDIAQRLIEQDARIRNCCSRAEQGVGADALRRAFAMEHDGHRTRNAAIAFGTQGPLELLARCAG